MKIRNVLVVYYVHNYNTLRLVELCLKEHKVEYKAVSRVYCNDALVSKYDLVISVGGDGTFLRAAHHINETPILSISSDVRYNEAFYARATPSDIEKKLRLLLNGKYKITKLPRLEAKVDGKKIPMLAVNEVFVGSKHPYHTSRYTITIGKKTEFQKSSGVLITTARGSTGWAKSASKKQLSISKDSFGYVVREPYFGRLTQPKLLGGNLSKNATVKINSQMHAGIVAIDSAPKAYKFTDGSKLVVRISKQQLNYIEF